MVTERPSHSTWRIGRAASDGTIWLKFVGPTPTHEVEAFLGVLTDILPPSHARVVFDLRELNGYNPESKQPIKKWLLQHKLVLEEVTVVIPKSGIWLRTVTAAIGLAVGVKIRVRDHVDAGEHDVTFASPSPAGSR